MNSIFKKIIFQLAFMKIKKKPLKNRSKGRRIYRNCALIPAYNEEKNIKQVVKKVKEIGILPVVIDDNSADRTIEIAKKTGAIVLRHESNKGKGEALRTGIRYTLKKMPNVKNIVFIDADMQYHPREAPKLIKLLDDGDADIVIGYRKWSSVPFRHALGNFVWRTTFNILFGTILKDTNCGIMAMTKKAVNVIINSLHGGYVIENSILSYAVKKRLKIEQVPVNVKYKQKSKVMRGVRMVGGIFVFIVKEGLKYRLGKI